MRDIATVAERLRVVRQAHRRFLELWRLEREVVGPLLDRVAADVVPDSLDLEAPKEQGLPVSDLHQNGPPADKP